MEEKKTLKIKKPRLIIFALAIAFAIMGIIDLKVNAAESLVEGIPVGEQYLKIDNLKYNTSNKHYYNIKHNFSNIQYRIALFYVSDGDYNGYSICTLDTGSYVYLYGNIITEEYDKNMVLLNSDSVDKQLGDNLYTGTTKPVTAHHYYNEGVVMNIFEFKSLTVDTNIPIFTDWDCLREYLETGFYNPSGVVIHWSEFLKNASVNDDMPCVTNLDFDRIESTVSNEKSITDYIRFDPNSDYRLAIMLCPSVYSPVRSNGFISKFEHYDYDNWVFMTTSDVGLKEISCNIGTFSIPTSGVDSIVESNYKRYYDSILYGLSDNGSVNFKPTMGYRLMYVDLSNNQIGPSTYILPNYYDNLDPDDETCSFFTLYSDGTKGSEKVMNLKTWKQDESMSLDDVKEVIDKVTNALDDYQIIDTELGVGDARNWLQSVASFIKGTPSFVGSVMSFLPEPIRYGMYVCLFLGVIASGYAIVKALI